MNTPPSQPTETQVLAPTGLNRKGIDALSKISLKDQVKEYICERIREAGLGTGDRLPTDRSLALELGVSRKTVELAMQDLEMRNLVFRRVGKGSFLVDESPASGTARPTEGVILLYVPNITNPHFARIAGLLEEEVFRNGQIAVLVHNRSVTGEDPQLVPLVDKLKVRGVIGIGIPEAILAFAKARRVACMNIVLQQTQPTRQIVLDIAQAGRLVADHLIALGHQDIVCAGSFPRVAGEPIELKFQAIFDRMAACGLEVDEPRNLVPQRAGPLETLDYERIGRELTEDILRLRKRPTAIIYANDARAIGGIRSLVDHGLSIPGDISVLGFDDLPMARLTCPSLTTIAFDYAKVTHESVRLLLGGDRPETQTFAPILIPRQSTARRHGFDNEVRP